MHVLHTENQNICRWKDKISFEMIRWFYFWNAHAAIFGLRLYFFSSSMTLAKKNVLDARRFRLKCDYRKKSIFERISFIHQVFLLLRFSDLLLPNVCTRNANEYFDRNK